MDLVAITDHDEISGALDPRRSARRHRRLRSDRRLSRRRRVRAPERVRPEPGDSTAEIQRLRHDVRELLPYLRQQQLFTSLNHVASGINGPITAPHVAALLPWVNALEVINGSRLPVQNRTAACLAEAAGKTGVAGSDSHTAARHRPHLDRSAGARTPRRVHGRPLGRPRARRRPPGQLLHDGVGHPPLRRQLLSRAGRRRPCGSRSAGARMRALFGGVFGLPLVPVALVGALPALRPRGALQREPAVRPRRAARADARRACRSWRREPCASPSSPTTTSTRSTASRRR